MVGSRPFVTHQPVCCGIIFRIYPEQRGNERNTNCPNVRSFGYDNLYNKTHSQFYLQLFKRRKK